MATSAGTLRFSIRPAMATDVERLRQIEIDAGRRFRDVGLDSIADEEPPAVAVLAAYIEAGGAWVAVDSTGVLIGYAVSSVVDGEAHLDQVSVVESAAGSGVGRALIDEVCRWAISVGSGALTLTTFRDVAWNGPYYERLGFRRLDGDELGPELAAIRSTEIASGLDVAPRCAMRRELRP